MKNRQRCILIVDDSEDDRLFIQRAFKRLGVTDELRLVSSGDEALRYFNGEDAFADRNQFPFPSLILTDLKMPRIDGFSVVEAIKTNPDWCIVPVLVLSTSEDPDDVKRSYMLGANSYLVKPHDHAELQRLLGIAYTYWMECKMPKSDPNGKLFPTRSDGKIGERFVVRN